jgi:FkbM family methyltransferase
MIEWLRPFLRRYPLAWGKGWLANKLARDSDIPDGLVVRTKDGISVAVHSDWIYKHIYLYGEYEPANTAVFTRIVRPGDVCFDVGANFGYYSCLLARYGAKVYGFEPLPAMLEFNKAMLELNGLQDVVHTEGIALGAVEGTITMHTFAGLSQGLATTADLGRPDAVAHECAMTTLDSFCARNGIRTIAFMKIDVEGCEQDVLAGGSAVLSAPVAPVIHFEVNEDCLAARRIDANAILDLLKRYGYSAFFRIKHYGGMERVVTAISNRNSDYMAFKENQLWRIER